MQNVDLREQTSRIIWLHQQIPLNMKNANVVKLRAWSILFFWPFSVIALNCGVLCTVVYVVYVTLTAMVGEVLVDIHRDPRNCFTRRRPSGWVETIVSGGSGQPKGGGVQGLRVQEVFVREGRAHEVSLSWYHC